jgi:hypothetical protein
MDDSAGIAIVIIVAALAGLTVFGLMAWQGWSILRDFLDKDRKNPTAGLGGDARTDESDHKGADVAGRNVSRDDASAAPALEPYFRTDEPNRAVTLYEGAIEVLGLIGGEGTVSLDWLPSPWVRFRVSSREIAQSDPSPLPHQIYMQQRALLTTGMVLGSELLGGATGATQHFRGVLDPTIEGEAESIERLIFHVPNFPAFVGASIGRHDERGFHGWNGRLQLDDGVWRVVLDPVEYQHDLLRRLNSTGGYGITNVGELRRVDSNPFTLGEARDLLASLRYFLSLVGGKWTDSTLRVGYASLDRVVAQEWHSPAVDGWGGRRSVFPEYVREEDRVRAPHLAPIFQTITSFWKDETWKDVITWCISWLIESDKAVNADTSVVLSQAGLELVAWAQLVLNWGMTPGEFKDLKAHEALSMLLEVTGVPVTIPNGTILNEMHGFAKENVVAGPEALTRLRNSVVHPRAGEKRPSPTLRHEAAQLGLWYLQLAILRLLNYEDQYLDRLRSWHAQPVPWTSGERPSPIMDT